MSEDWAKGGQEVSSQMVGFNQIGDFIKGTYTGKKRIESKDVWLYELKGVVGQFHKLDDNKKLVAEPVVVAEGEYYQVWGGKSKIDDLFAKFPFGEIVAVQFSAEIPSKVKGNNPFKDFKTLNFGKDPNYMGESSDAGNAVVDSADVEGVDF